MNQKTKNILVLGGTRYFGKRLVSRLIEQEFSVTIATRGKTPDPFSDRVQRVILDRYDRQSLAKGIGKQDWDVVYDQICYAPDDAADACEILAGKVGRYIFTSSMSVYGSGALRRETDFDPSQYVVQPGRRETFSYAEGKRQAEAVFFQKAAFPVVIVRFPVVLGSDDYTGRLQAPIQAVKNGLPLRVYNLSAAISLISSEEASSFLARLSHQKLSGIFNAASKGDVTIGALIRMIEQATNKKAAVIKEKTEDPFSLTALEETLTLDATKAQKKGFEFKVLEQWLKPLIKNLSNLS